MRYFTLIGMIFVCIIIDTITAQATEADKELKKTVTQYQGYRRHGGHAARPQIIHGPIILCPSKQQHDSNGKCRSEI